MPASLPKKIVFPIPADSVVYGPPDADSTSTDAHMKARTTEDGQSLEESLSKFIADTSGNPANSIYCWLEYDPASGQFRIVCVGK